MVLQQWFEALNRKDVAAIHGVAWPDVVIHSLFTGSGECTFELEAYMKVYWQTLALLSDLDPVVEDYLSDGDLRAVRYVITAVHRDEKIEGKIYPLYFTGMAMARLRDGKIAEIWNYFDFESMYQQME